MALWPEAHNLGQPLNFLDHHIKCGNAIVGFVQREELDKGVPNEAFATTPGVEKDLAARWRNANKKMALREETNSTDRRELLSKADDAAEFWTNWRTCTVITSAL